MVLSPAEGLGNCERPSRGMAAMRASGSVLTLSSKQTEQHQGPAKLVQVQYHEAKVLAQREPTCEVAPGHFERRLQQSRTTAISSRDTGVDKALVGQARLGDQLDLLLANQ